MQRVNGVMLLGLDHCHKCIAAQSRKHAHKTVLHCIFFCVQVDGRNIQDMYALSIPAYYWLHSAKLQATALGGLLL